MHFRKKIVSSARLSNDAQVSWVVASSLLYGCYTGSFGHCYEGAKVFWVFILTLLLLLRWDTGKVRDSFGGMVRFNCGLRCKGWVNSVIIINVIAENYRWNYIRVFLKYKHNVKTCMYTIITLNQMITLNVSTHQLRPPNIEWDEKTWFLELCQMGKCCHTLAFFLAATHGSLRLGLLQL